MNPGLFKDMVEKNSMKIVSQKPIFFDPENNWSGEDTITIFEK